MGRKTDKKKKPLYLDSKRSIEERMEDLVSRMTLEEKAGQMGHSSPEIKRLGIPQYNWWNECLHGVAVAGIATVFPQAIGLGATWDTDLVHRLAIVTSDEARAKHHDAVRKGKRDIFYGLTFWSPNINIFRDPRWGRGQETYGEDPWLTAQLGIQFVKGLQGDDPKYLKLVSTPKHYAVHSGPEPLRHRFNAITNERDLRMTYLPAFKACVQEGGAYSVMCAYNRYHAKPCCGNKYLIQDILRGEWGFEGYVVSDCGAILNFYRDHKVVATEPEAVAMGIKGGCDLNCGEAYGRSIVEAAKKGLLSEEEIDKSLKRLFKARFLLGMFDPPNMVPYTKIPFKIVDAPEHRELALEAARKSIVLLKNEKKLLPLKKNIKTIAVVGPNADDVKVLLGNYNGTPSIAVTPLEGIRNKISQKTKILFAKGCGISTPAEFAPIPAKFLCPAGGKKGQKGLKAEYFNNVELKGKPVLSRIDETVDFDWGEGSPDPEIQKDRFSARWTGTFTPPKTGKYRIGTTADDGSRLFLDNELIIDDWHDHAPQTHFKDVNLIANRPYSIKMEYYENLYQASAKLVWIAPDMNPLKKAEEITKKADLVIAVMGISQETEGETYDKKNLNLPAIQEQLLKMLHKTGKPIILVLLNGSPLSINWADKNIPAIIEAWYPGEEGGTAIADVIFGDYNPGARLPITFYKSIEQVPPFENYNMRGRTYRYMKKEPLYPFGYGLSFTKFRYSELKIAPKKIKTGDEISVSVRVKNIGKIAGDEVAQLYVSDLKASAPVPVRQLAGFQRIHLKPNREKVLEFKIKPEQLSFFNYDNQWIVEPGEFEISVGGCQPSAKYEQQSGSRVLIKKFQITGEKMILKG